MSDIKLFRVGDGTAVEMVGSALAIEKTLQTLIEQNLEPMLGIRLVASEHSTGKAHGGRIDTLGLDENGSPVILEYKRSTNQNVINQGLFYLDWLLDHRADFTLLAMKALGAQVEEEIDWSATRLLCIAGSFTKYDEHAVSQIGRNVELYRYRSYAEGFLALELVNRTAGATESTEVAPRGKTKTIGKTVTEYLAQANPALVALYDALDAFLQALGDDVSVKRNQNYFAYRRIKNFACVEVHPQSARLLVYVKGDPAQAELAEGFSRDVSKIGHFGTGNIEIRIASESDFARAKVLLERSYDRN